MNGINEFSRKDLTRKQWEEIIIKQFPSEWVEYSLSIFAICWGGWVSMPWFSVFDTSPKIYRYMLLLLPDEFAWGVIVFVMGVILRQLLFLDNLRGRFATLIIFSCVFATMSACYFLADWRSFAWINYLLIAQSANWCRSRVHARLIEKKRDAINASATCK